jgi:thymidylate synthase (FAD)
MFTDEIAGSKNYLDLFSPIKSLDYEVQSIIDKECIDGIPPVKLYHPQVKRSVIEHYSLSFVVLCDRATSHELVRHRIGASYTQLSQRYVSYGDVTTSVPVVISPDYNVDETCLITDAAITAVSEYRGAVLYSGIKPEVARQVLPNAIGTILLVTFNPRSLRHFLELRMSKGAYSPIRCIANEIYDIMIDSGLEILVKEYEDLRKYDPRIKNYSIETED